MPFSGENSSFADRETRLPAAFSIPRRPAEALQCRNIPAVVALFIHRRLENERLRAKRGMRQDAAKALLSDLAFSDVGMTVETRTERTFGVVGVDHFHLIHAESEISRSDGLIEARGGGHVITGRQKMAGIEAVCDREIGLAGGEIPNRAQLFKFAPDLIPASDSVFEQHGQARRPKSSRRPGKRHCELRHALLESLALVAARMKHEIVGP